MNVHLRQRQQTKNGRISLYLEYYKGTTATPDGKTKPIREYEYLDLYLVGKPKNAIDRQSNKDTMELAKSIRAKREVEIKNGQYGFTSTVKKSANFVEYFKQKAEERKKSKGNYGNWDSAIKHLIAFAGGGITFQQIDEAFCQRFVAYLEDEATKKSGGPLSTSSINSYFNKFRACLKHAVKDKIIPQNPATDVRPPKIVQSKREYLTLVELKAVAKTECRYEVLKRAFIFSCLTGLRWSDINKLKWGEVQHESDGWRIVFHQKKTKGLQYLDISDQARDYLGEVGKPDERVFTGLTYSAYMNVELTKWMLKAGITKDITFHCGRHTYAVLQLEMGTDIFTLSKMLGHSEIKTTQIYAQVVDKKKKEAANRIPNIQI